MVVVPAARGGAWIRDGWQLVRRKPVLWMALVFAYWLLMSLLGGLRYVGVPLGLMLVPALSMSFMNVARAAERGEELEFRMLFSDLKAAWRRLALLGVVYLVAFLLVLTATRPLDGGVLMRLMLGQALHEDNIAALRTGALAFFAFYAPVMAAFWFAPMLATWRGMGVVQSLFYSFFATLGNWRAFLLYGLALAIAVGLLPGVLLAMLAMLAKPLAGLLPYLMAAFFAVVVPVVYASFYVSYRDVFPPEPSDSPAHEAASE
jgi:hypothetical protein